MLDCQIPNSQLDDPNAAISQGDGKEKKKRIGFSEKLEIIRLEKLARGGPDPWLTRKFAVGLVIALYIFVWYVFVIRLCVPMIRMDRIRQGGRRQGLAYLIVYHILFSMFIWSYYRVVSIPPGFARDFVEISEPPIEECELITPTPQFLPVDLPPTTPSSSSQLNLTNIESTNSQKMRLQRIPPETRILSLNYRYDLKNRFIRPTRSHNCRHCGTVVLNLDHHCPWVGHCVGSRNRKYYYNFLQASTLFELFIFISTTIACTFHRNSALDGQQLAIIIISGIFCFFFTSPLLMAHTRLILLNITTIEDLNLRRIINRERALLAREFGSFGNWKEKREVKERWNREWGRVTKEGGNIWWLGSRRKNWEMVMGKSIWGWFLPVEASPNGDDDGLSYVPNPRFSKDGIWRKRREWPEELQ